jgi:hypothetical protein
VPVRFGGVCSTSGWDPRRLVPSWARKSRGERSESLREKEALVESSGGRDLGDSSGVPGDCGGRSCRVRDEAGRSDERRGWAVDLASVFEGMRLTVGVVELEGTGEGDCKADGDDIRFTRAMRERNLSWRAVAESTWRCFGALSSAMFRKRSSVCSPSVAEVVSVAPCPLFAARRAS